MFEFPDNKYDVSPSVLYNTRDRNEKVCNLLLLTEGDKQHLVRITNFSGLLRKSTENNNKRHYCTQCLDGSFLTEEALKTHLEACYRNEACTIVLPKKNGEQGLTKKGKLKQREDLLTFRNDGNKFKHPFYCCLDFEATLKPIDEDDEINTKDTTTSNYNYKCSKVVIPKVNKVIKYQEHVPNSYGLKYNCIHNQFSEPIKIFNNADQDNLLKDTFIELERLAKKSYDLVQQNKHNVIMTRIEKQKHNKYDNCPTCNVRDRKSVV